MKRQPFLPLVRQWKAAFGSNGPLTSASCCLTQRVLSLVCTECSASGDGDPLSTGGRPCVPGTSWYNGRAAEGE